MGGFILAEATVLFPFFSFFLSSVWEIWKKRMLLLDSVYFAFCLFWLCFNDFHDFRCFDKAYLVLRKHRESPLRESKLQLPYTTPRFLESLCVVAFILSRRSSPFF